MRSLLIHRYWAGTLICFLLLFVSCKREYKYVETGCPEVGDYGFASGPTTTITIKAYTKDGAKNQAKELFLKRRQNYIETVDLLITGKATSYKKSIGESEENEIYPIPFSYKLLSNQKYMNEEIGSSYWFSYADNLGGGGGEKNKVSLLGAEFGMTPSEVKNLASFSSYKWDNSNNMLCGKEIIGLREYDVHLIFFNDALFRVEILSPFGYTNADPYIKDMRNLRNVFWRAYGKPSHYSSITTYHLSANNSSGIDLWSLSTSGIYDINYPYFAVYEWENAFKLVRVGYDKASPRGSRTVTTITGKDWIRQREAADKQMEKDMEDYRKAADAAKEEQLNNSAEMFK